MCGAILPGGPNEFADRNQVPVFAVPHVGMKQHGSCVRLKYGYICAQSDTIASKCCITGLGDNQFI